jgi:predicted RNA polymerase sigma factor
VTGDDVELRELVPKVLSVLVRRGADFATAEDAVQEALIRALSTWEDDAPSDPEGWLITVSWRAFIDMARSDAARRDRDVRFDTEPRLVSCRRLTTPCTSTSCVRIPT